MFYSLPLSPTGRTCNAVVFSYESLLTTFRSMLAATPAPLSIKSPSIAGVVTPSKVNQSGRSTLRIKQQQQQQQQQKQGKQQLDSSELLLDTSTPSKVAVGHDFRYSALFGTPYAGTSFKTKSVLECPSHFLTFRILSINPYTRILVTSEGTLFCFWC
jgi:hypothetical protein